MKEERNERGAPRKETIVGEESILELILTNDMFCESHMDFILGSEDLNVLGNTGGIVLDGPRPEDRVLICRSLICIVPSRKDKTSLSLIHSSPNQVSVLEAGALEVNHTGAPNWNLI